MTSGAAQNGARRSSWMCSMRWPSRADAVEPIERAVCTLVLAQQLRQLGNVGRDPPRFVAGQEWLCPAGPGASSQSES
jgi:hypothetical protein